MTLFLSDFRSTHHLPSHDLAMLSVTPDHVTESANQITLLDKDYAGFKTSTGFNYLDPNFHPAN